MSQNVEAGATHTGEAFLEFVYDLLEYSVPKYDYEWIRPVDSKRSPKKIFKESFGDAVVLFRNRHIEEFEERLEEYAVTQAGSNIVSYSDKFCETFFKGKVPLMEIIVYCAFLLDCTIFYLYINRPAEVDVLTDQAFGVFYKYIETFFTIVGGWHALYRVAEQYVDFVNFSAFSISSESASDVESDMEPL